MPAQGLKTVATQRNGVRAFILPCLRLSLHYCDWAGSSRGMNAFLTSPLLQKLTSQYPGIEFRISPRPRRHPVLKAEYVNGRTKAVCVRNKEKEQILKMAEFLVGNNGERNRFVRGKKVISENESVRGIWSPMHGGIQDV